MKKNVFLIVLALLISCISYGQEKVNRIVENGAPKEFPRFAVISDVHFGNSVGEGPMVKVPKALKNLTGKDKLDAIFVVGDVTDYGNSGQYDQLLQVFNNQSNVPEGVAVYYMMGNHDNYNDPQGASFKSKLNQPLDQYVEIKDYPFITLSMNGTGAENYSQATKDFLAEKLAFAAGKYPGKPVFVFTHVPPKNTCYGSSTSEGWGSNAFLSILNQYPQAVVFSGHSHFSMVDPRSIHQDKFTSINVGGSTYSEVESGAVNIGIHPEAYDNITEGLIVNVLESGNVELERWDTYRNEKILPAWIIETPFDGNNFSYKGRNGKPEPSFPANAKPEVDVKDESYTVKFPQATDNEVVFRYLIEILENSQVITSFYKFSQFYLNSQMPKELSVDFPYSYLSEKTFVAKITAIDSYNNRSIPIESEPFILAPHTPDPDAELPVATIFDIEFGKNGVFADISPLQNVVTTGAIKPETYFNDNCNRWTAKFTDSRDCYYKIDYQNNQKIKDAFSNAFSLELYYRCDNTGKTVAPLSTQESGGAGFEQTSGNVLQFWIHLGGSYKTINTPLIITAGKYYHLVATYDKAAGKVEIYADGTKIIEQNVSGNFGFPPSAAQWIGIGGDAHTSAQAQSPLRGEIAIVRMYDKAVSRDEVALLYIDRIKELTGISSSQPDKYTIFAEDKTIHVKGLSASDFVSVYNLLGVKIAAGHSVNGYMTLNVHSKGIHIVKIQSERKLFTGKISVK